MAALPQHRSKILCFEFVRQGKPPPHRCRLEQKYCSESVTKAVHRVFLASGEAPSHTVSMSKLGTQKTQTEQRAQNGAPRKRRPRFYEPETPPQPTHCQHPECD